MNEQASRRPWRVDNETQWIGLAARVIDEIRLTFPDAQVVSAPEGFALGRVVAIVIGPKAKADAELILHAVNGQWQPIDGAPKDGTPILALRFGLRPVLVQWHTFEGKSRWSLDPDEFLNDDHFRDYWNTLNDLERRKLSGLWSSREWRGTVGIRFWWEEA